MKGPVLIILMLQIVQQLAAQDGKILYFDSRLLIDTGISVAPYTTLYKTASGDESEPVQQVLKQKFLPLTSGDDYNAGITREMSKTTEINWIRFKIVNPLLTDTLQLWYDGGPHAKLTLFEEAGNKLRLLSEAGMCVIPHGDRPDAFALRLSIPPQTTRHFFVRVTDYLMLFAGPAGTIHSAQTYNAHLVKQMAEIKWLFFSMSMIIGCLFLMSLYSLYQYYLNRDKAFLYYAVYAMLGFCWILKFANPRFELGITPRFMPVLAHPWALSLTPAMSLVYCLFLTRILDIKGNQRHLWKWIGPTMFILAVQQVFIITQLFTGILISDTIIYFLIDALPSLVMGLLMIFATIRSSSKLKPYLLAGEISLYLIAFSPFHGFLFIDISNPVATSFLNYPPFFMALGLFTELFCFSLALAYRNKLSDLEKNDLQKNYTERLESDLSKRSIEILSQSQELEKQHAAKLELEFERRFAAMEMTALRAQMNPHFIFNCLNSIKLYTTDNDGAKASVYLTKFGRLIRLVLENSSVERVTLAIELETLQLYLEMEQMRFKDKLDFSIEVSPDLETDMVEIPPMLLQPYIENAIWHGLMHKKEGGRVNLKIMPEGDDKLAITITDNGVGRTVAAELKSKSAMTSKSFGMKITGERISLLNQAYKTNAKVQVIDLTKTDGSAAGTSVVILISI